MTFTERCAQAMVDPSKATIDALVEEFFDMPGNSMGGLLHSNIDDTNIDDDSIDRSIVDARAAGDVNAEALARLLRAVPMIRRCDLALMCPCCVDNWRELAMEQS